MIEITIDVDKIPKERIWTGKNGARKLFATLGERKEVGQYGETHTLYLWDKDAKEKTYIGSGKVKEWNGQTKGLKAEPKRAEHDDLPF